MRDYRAADAERVAGLLGEVLPYFVTSAHGVQAQVAGAPARQRYRLLLAEAEDGRLLGCVRTGLFADASQEGAAFANLTVAPQARGRGVGGALLAAAERHLAAAGAASVYAWGADTPAVQAFAAHRGYRTGRAATYLRLDLGSGSPLPEPPVPTVPGGADLLPAARWAADPWPLYRADVESFRDEPGDVDYDGIGYADWRALTWDRPDFDPALSTVAVVGGEVAALVLVQTDGAGRYWSGGTGTRRAFRGMGLAKAAKAHSLHLARAAGCRTAYTGNDDGNAPMLAINLWLGYHPCGSERRYIRELVQPLHPFRSDGLGTAGVPGAAGHA
ncbi:GNAT family N-acetyltransferase [Streptomyces sp. KK5PA1]|uniref:GNAT family N-acetyltransferase n=1 Tax=Actinacidiphila acididurans TaxID=2784346 RepID=A0ABS2TX87_9ACTN|nr:GNAT family N-acetyltransferase [Actinacidiphila acididurans]